MGRWSFDQIYQSTSSSVARTVYQRSSWVGGSVFAQDVMTKRTRTDLSRQQQFQWQPLLPQTPSLPLFLILSQVSLLVGLYSGGLEVDGWWGL